ncbi:ABC transporter substrate-binding protein [Clostridium sp. FP1]|uniref:ABC transporter substrate-binding protein n=1 Tax=Clostridium sp. FP1 TaxID=2724076 RepID=UPI0013E99C3F|nr:ABC transporter substrate-binding protein [Clostridium sp. FP1]MBZ9633595.1 ABC transporter substrate-binding protein [Clostridium sp. FP1]
MRRKLCKILAAVTVISLVFTGCGNKNQANVKESEKQEIKKGGVVKEAITSAPEGIFMPAFFTFNDDAKVNLMIYEGLLGLDEKMELKPRLAESYKVSDDKKTVTFKIRKGVKWHDGKPFTADDVKFTFDFVSNPKYNGPYTMFVNNIKGYDEFKAGKSKDLEGVKKIDDNTVSITTKNIYGSSLMNFGYMMTIIPKHVWDKSNVEAVQKDTNLIRNPIGTGSFKLGKFTPDQGVELVANNDYWGGKPNIDKYILKLVSSDTADAQLANKEVDIMGVGDITKEEQEAYKNKGFKVEEIVNNAYQYMGLNLRKPQFSNKKVRQAFTYAMNRESIVKDVLNGHGEIANNPFPSNFWAHPEGLNEYKYNPKKAMELLKESGWQYKEAEKKMYYNGKPFKFTLRYKSGDDAKTKYALIVQQNFKDIGIEIELKPMEFAAMTTDVKSANFDAFLMGNGNFYDGDLSPSYLSTLTPPNGYNYTGFNNKKVDELLLKASKLMTKDERKPILNQAALELNNELPVIYVYHWSSLMVVDTKIKNFKNAQPAYYIYAKDWYVDNKKIK